MAVFCYGGDRSTDIDWGNSVAVGLATTLANPNFDQDKAAKIVLDAEMMGDEAASKKWSVSERSIQRYRKKLGSSPELARVVESKKALQDAAWAHQIPEAIEACIKYIREAAEACDRSDPNAVHAIAGAAKVLSEIKMTREVIDARLAESHRQNDEAPGQVVAIEAQVIEPET